MTLDQTLYRLLFHRSAREAFLASATDDPALAAIDRDQLQKAADRIVQDLLGRKHRGIGTLGTVFSRSFARWVSAHPEDAGHVRLAQDFLQSDAAAAWREIPYAGPGISVEEAFARFACAPPFEADEVQDELYTGLAKVLLLNPRPSFSLPPAFRSCPGGWLAVVRGNEPMLYAASLGRFVRGPITTLVADVLDGGVEGSAAVLEKLRPLGLVA